MLCVFTDDVEQELAFVELTYWHFKTARPAVAEVAGGYLMVLKVYKQRCMSCPVAGSYSAPQVNHLPTRVKIQAAEVERSCRFQSKYHSQQLHLLE